MNTIQKAIEWAVSIANDSRHGYDQRNRWGPDFDCSSLVISAYKQAGVPLTCTYTGNMLKDMLSKGFVLVHGTTQPGDVLLNVTKGHTALYIGNNKLVQASISENGTAHAGKAGDQTGREINVCTYYDFPWEYALRYSEERATANAADIYRIVDCLPVIRYGDENALVAAIQASLKYYGYSVGVCGIDGDFGTATKNAVIRFQTDHALTPDGEVGKDTYTQLWGGIKI